jgi:hypothetical protein
MIEQFERVLCARPFLSASVATRDVRGKRKAGEWIGREKAQNAQKESRRWGLDNSNVSRGLFFLRLLRFFAAIPALLLLGFRADRLGVAQT